MATIHTCKKVNRDGSTRFLVVAVAEHTPADELARITGAGGDYAPLTFAEFVAEAEALKGARGDGECVIVFYTVDGARRTTAGEMRDNAARTRAFLAAR